MHHDDLPKRVTRRRKYLVLLIGWQCSVWLFVGGHTGTWSATADLPVTSLFLAKQLPASPTVDYFLAWRTGTTSTVRVNGRQNDRICRFWLITSVLRGYSWEKLLALPNGRTCRTYACNMVPATESFCIKKRAHNFRFWKVSRRKLDRQSPMYLPWLLLSDCRYGPAK